MTIVKRSRRTVDQPRRRRSGYGAALILFLLIGGAYTLLAPRQTSPTTTPTALASSTASSSSAAQISAGRQLFVISCSTCHGLNAEGTGVAPSLIGVGSAAVDFQVGTGRMPAPTYDTAEETRKPPKFNQTQINELAAYIQSLAPGPQIPTDLNYQAANSALGGDLFRTNCASCHNVIGSGGELAYGAYAPALDAATAKQIYEAMLTGPENMPVFGNGVITPQEKLDIVKYLLKTRSEADPGGNGLGRIGPVSEGLVGWVFGIGVLVLITVWIGARA
jgi:ubiquinol-cytochrome c reductase cytochrome c subunit